MELFDEFFSLLIVIVAIIYTFSSMAKTIARSKKPMSKHGRQQDEYYDDEEDDEESEEETFEDFIKAVKTQERIEENFPIPPSPIYAEPSKVTPIANKFEFEANLDDYSQTTNIDDRKLTISLRPGDELVSDAFRLAQTEGLVMKRPQRPTIQQLISSLPQDKLLFLSYEVFHVPVSKRPSPFPWNG